jgi:TolB-like protein
VLPFVNMSRDAKYDYLSDGITEEILNALAQIPDLKVAARTSAFAFKGKAEDLRKVGETLGVAKVLEGSVQSDGDELRITAQLIDTRTGFHVWSQKYDRKLTNVFAIEDEISRAIADKLRAQWGGQPLVRSGTQDAQAHALYLKGIAAIAARGVALKQAAALLEQATARDPGYAAAWAQLSQVHELFPWYELGPWDASLDAAERTARRALALDDQSAEAHAALANVLRDRFAFAESGREYRRSLELNPGLSEVHNQYGQLLDAIGQFDAAVAQEQIAIAQDPLAPNPQYMLGILFDSQRRHAEASAAYERVIRIAPQFIYSHDLLAFSRMYAGDYVQAQAVAAAASVPTPDGRSDENRQVIATLITAVAEPSRRAQALPLVADLQRIGHTDLGGLARAFWYGLLDAREPAIKELLHWADTAPQGQRFNGLRFLWMPAFDPLRADARFKALLGKFGLPDLSVDALRGGAKSDAGAAGGKTTGAGQ